MKCIASGMLLAAALVQGGQSPFDLVIRGGRIADGSGSPAVAGDVAIAGGRIARVGRVPASAGRTVIDATGLVVAPGFIDVHTHADDIAKWPAAENFARMGVTSIVAGNCGGSALDVAAALETIRRTGVAINFATLIGHNTVRRAVMGTAQRPPTPDELTKMKSLVWRGMTDGAVGFSTGLQYVPGTYADTFEILSLARVAAEAGGLYASHMRNEGTRIEEAIREALEIGEGAGCPVQISHLKIDSPSRWGASVKALALIDEARRRGVDVRADQYLYTAASSGLGIRFPAWALEGGAEETAKRLADESTWQKIRTEMIELLADRGLKDLSFAVVASYRPDPSLNGRSMDRVAEKLKGRSDRDAQLEAARDMMRQGGAQMVYHFMSDEDVETILRHPEVGVASDSSVLQAGEGIPHPRGYGNNARVLGLYVRQKKTVTLEEAIRKMTSLPAAHFRFADRGLVKQGYAADLVVFDPGRVSDPATFDAPHQYATGIPHVIVNGVPIIRDGRPTGARPGQLLIRAGGRR
jgi:N-acyl-D-amino-acid deacylase